MIYCFFSTIICVHPLKKTPLHKQEFLLVFLTRFSSTFQLKFPGKTSGSPPTLGFGSIDVWGLFFWGVGYFMFEKAPPPKKTKRKKTRDLYEVTTVGRWWGYSHPNGLSSLLKLGKDCIVTVLDFKFQSGVFSQIPPNAPFFLSMVSSIAV